jgi:hypothetical protein
MKTPYQVDKLKVVHKRNIDHFIKEHGIAYPKARKMGRKWIVPKQGKRQGNTMFMTMTFSKLIYAKGSAEKEKFRYLRDLRVYTPFDYCCVPEKHSSGAYHFHLLISLHDKDISLNEFKDRIRRLRFIGFIDVEWTWGPVESVSYYLTQYLTAENLNAIKGRSISYSKGVNRVANTRFVFWNPYQVKMGWRQKWKNMSMFIPREMGWPENVVKQYYNKIVCRRGFSDRYELLKLSKLQSMDKMYAYVIKGICDYILTPEYKNFSQSYDYLCEVEKVCKDTFEYENGLSGVPF